MCTSPFLKKCLVFYFSGKVDSHDQKAQVSVKLSGLPDPPNAALMVCCCVLPSTHDDYLNDKETKNLCVATRMETRGAIITEEEERKVHSVIAAGEKRNPAEGGCNSGPCTPS